MADVKAIEGAEFPEKRKLDLPNLANKSLEEDKGSDESNKRPKLEIPSGENGENVGKSDEPDVKADVEEEDDEEEEYNAEQDEEEEEIVDRKGKGIMRDDKGKGKMIEDSEDDDSDGHDVNDDDDSSDDSDSDFSDGLDESDLEDDPLAEVDLDNILPSRTRQRQVQRGVVFKDSDKGNDA